MAQVVYITANTCMNISTIFSCLSYLFIFKPSNKAKKAEMQCKLLS